MLETLTAIGGALGGLGQAASGLGGLFGGGGGQSPATTLGQQQLQFAMDAAGKQIQWRVKDAKDAGIHPLYALGAPAFNPTSISIPGDDRQGVDWGGSLAKMSQGIGRAIDAMRTKEQREISELDLAAASQAAAGRQLDLEMKRTQLGIMQEQLRRFQGGQLPPPLPNSATNENGGPKTAATNQSTIKENEITSSQGDIPHSAAGPVAPSNQWRAAPDGRLYPTPEKNLQMDDMGSPGWLPWMYRNHVLPYAKQTLGRDVTEYGPPRHMLPPGADGWEKNLDGSWTPVYRRLDRDVGSTRHNRLIPKWADPKYRRY